MLLLAHNMPVNKISKETKKKRLVAKTMNSIKNDCPTSIEYPLPTIYADLDRLESKEPISRIKIYGSLSRLTPYLVKRLVYESANQNNPPSVRVKATQVLIDKILPSVSAEQISVNSEDLQSLVIVKTDKTRK